MESLELAVLDRLEGMFPEEFELLSEFCGRHPSVGSPFADGFAADLRFYMDYRTYMERMRQRGYAFAYPEFHKEETVRICAGYDLSLAREADARVTPNDFFRDAGESIIVTGPNQGGKTAYVRMVGQVAYFACLGLPAPCERLELYFIEEIRTHFAREEDLSNNYGRLKEELQRAKNILDALPAGSLVLLNDLFASTTTFDALEIGGKLLVRLMKRGCLCLFATNFHELAATPGMARLHAAPDDSTKAYRVTREPPGRLTASRLIPAYRLTYDDIRSRL
jgi:DNA mismatch repair ATPase MutS